MRLFSRKPAVVRNLEKNARDPRYQTPDYQVRSASGSGEKAERARQNWEMSREHMEELYEQANRERREFEERRAEEARDRERRENEWYWAQKCMNDLGIDITDPYRDGPRIDFNESYEHFYKRASKEQYDNWLNNAG